MWFYGQWRDQFTDTSKGTDSFSGTREDWDGLQERTFEEEFETELTMGIFHLNPHFEVEPVSCLLFDQPQYLVDWMA